MISYVIKLLLDPALLVFFVLVLAWLLSWLPWRGLVRRLLLISIAILGLVYFGPIPALLSQPLAKRFPPADFANLPAPEFIVVLGGMTASVPAYEPGSTHPAFVGRSERFLFGMELAQRFPHSTLVFTGWAGEAAGVEGAEATRLTALARALGLPAYRLLTEPLAQTTKDHPIELEALPDFGTDPDAITYIVTSAIHMPRAIGSFRQAGWTKVYAAPTDYPFPLEDRLWSRRQPAGKKLSITQQALVEWVGLLTYRLRGHTAALFPAP